MKTGLPNSTSMAARGILALALAGYAFFVDGFTRNEWLELMALPWIVLGLCVYGLLDGALVISMGWSARRSFCAVTAFQGMATIGAAIALLTGLFVKVHLEWFAMFAAAQCIVIGVGELAAGTRLRRHLADEVTFFSAGTISILFAVALLLFAHGSTHETALWLTAYGVAMACTHLWMASRVHEWHRHAHRLSRGAAA